MPNFAKAGKLIAVCAGRVPRSCWIALVLLDCLFSLCWVASTHIVISGGEYTTISEKHILPYDWGRCHRVRCMRVRRWRDRRSLFSAPS